MEVDSRPIKLRAEDAAVQAPADDPFTLIVNMHEVLRHLLDESLQARDLMSRAPIRDVTHRDAQVHGRLVDIADTAGLASNGMDRLTRALRAAGRL